MSKHTPGPWRVTGAASGGISIDAKDPADNRGFELCEVWGVDCDKDATKDDRAKANANLIAAAPDLLEALEKMVEYAHQYSSRERSQAAAMEINETPISDDVSEARKAIARAKGEPQ